MLVLSRKQKQQIRIGNDVVLTVLQVKGNSVRIGIEAPDSVHIVRGELETRKLKSPAEGPSRNGSNRICPKKSAMPTISALGDGSPSILAHDGIQTTGNPILHFRIRGSGNDKPEGRPSRTMADIASSLPAVRNPSRIGRIPS